MKALLENPDPKAVDPNRIGIAGPKPGRASRPAMPTGPPVDDEFSFWRYRDLVERRIVSDRTDLFRKQQRGFPKAVKFSKGQGAVALFRVAEVKQWVLARTWRRAIPTMTAPVRPSAQAAGQRNRAFGGDGINEGRRLYREANRPALKQVSDRAFLAPPRPLRQAPALLNEKEDAEMTNDLMPFTSLAEMLDAVLEAPPPRPETIKLASPGEKGNTSCSFAPSKRYGKDAPSPSTSFDLNADIFYEIAEQGERAFAAGLLGLPCPVFAGLTKLMLHGEPALAIIMAEEVPQAEHGLPIGHSGAVRLRGAAARGRKDGDVEFLRISRALFVATAEGFVVGIPVEPPIDECRDGDARNPAVDAVRDVDRARR